jgi:excisionase family DNA binding protein
MAQAYLTPDQVAEKLQLCTESVYRLLRSGKLRGAHVSRKCWRVADTEVERFMRGGK